MRFISVGDALGELVPKFDRVVHRASQELVVTTNFDPRHDVLMRRRTLKVTLSDDHIFIDVGLNLLCLARVLLRVLFDSSHCFNHIKLLNFNQE